MQKLGGHGCVVRAGKQERCARTLARTQGAQRTQRRVGSSKRATPLPACRLRGLGSLESLDLLELLKNAVNLNVGLVSCTNGSAFPRIDARQQGRSALVPFAPFCFY
jgi:hypothetical protein